MTLTELGKIMLANFTPEEIQQGYKIRVDPQNPDLALIGEQALRWGDIRSDGTLN